MGFFRPFRKKSFFRSPFAIVVVVLGSVIAMPIVAVAAASQSGLSAISDTLAVFSTVTHLVEIKDADGNVIRQFQASTTWPVRGKVSLEFGADDSPYQRYHTGIDIEGAVGDPITTFMSGTVTKIDKNPNNSTGYGEYVIVDHGSGLTSLYGHMSDVLAMPHQKVVPGDVIGLRGSTGHATGPHVHFEIRVAGIPVNPRTFMVGDPTP